MAREFTLTHDRFQVSCSNCGLLEQFTNKMDAFSYAIRIKPKHTDCNSKIEVYDAMAHKNCQNLWEVL